MKDYSITSIESRLRWLYPVWIVFALFSVAYVPAKIFVKNNISQTASNFSQHEVLVKLSIIGTLTTGVLMIYVSYYLYLLFINVNKDRALLMLILALTSIPLLGFQTFTILALESVDANFIYASLNTSHMGQIVAEVFWGLWLFPLGRLVIESNYLPKFLGYALMASCIGYLIGVVTKIALPDNSILLLTSNILAFGELIFALWFTIRGLNLKSRS